MASYSRKKKKRGEKGGRGGGSKNKTFLSLLLSFSYFLNYIPHLHALKIIPFQWFHNNSSASGVFPSLPISILILYRNALLPLNSVLRAYLLNVSL